MESRGAVNPSLRRAPFSATARGGPGESRSRLEGAKLDFFRASTGLTRRDAARMTDTPTPRAETGTKAKGGDIREPTQRPSATDAQTFR